MTRISTILLWISCRRTRNDSKRIQVETGAIFALDLEEKKQLISFLHIQGHLNPHYISTIPQYVAVWKEY